MAFLPGLLRLRHDRQMGIMCVPMVGMLCERMVQSNTGRLFAVTLEVLLLGWCYAPWLSQIRKAWRLCALQWFWCHCYHKWMGVYPFLNEMTNVLERRREQEFRKQLHTCSLLLFKNWYEQPFPWTVTPTPLITPKLLWSVALSKLGSSIFLPIMVNLAMSAAAALQPVTSFSSRLAWCELLLPAGSCLVSVAHGRRRYLRCGAWARLALCSPKPLQRPARISSGMFLSHRFLNRLVKGTSFGWGGVSDVFISYSSALGLPPSVKWSLWIMTGPNCPNGFNSWSVECTEFAYFA